MFSFFLCLVIFFLGYVMSGSKGPCCALIDTTCCCENDAGKSVVFKSCKYFSGIFCGGNSKICRSYGKCSNLGWKC